MSSTPDFISLSSSPVSSGNNNGRNNRPHFNRGYNHNQTHRFNGFRNNYSPYQREHGRKSFSNSPRFERPNDISAYYHPSMMQDPWKHMELARNSPHNSSTSYLSPGNPINIECLDQSSTTDCENNVTKSSVICE